LNMTCRMWKYSHKSRPNQDGSSDRSQRSVRVVVSCIPLKVASA